MIAEIQSLPNWQAMSAAQIHAALAEVHAVPNPRRWVLADFLDQFELQEAVTVAAALKDSSNPFVHGAYIALCTIDGLSMESPTRQAMVDLLGLPEPLSSAVKSLGIIQLTRWEQMGGVGELPTEQQIEAAISAYRFEQRRTNAIALFAERMTSASDAGALMTQAWIDAGN